MIRYDDTMIRNAKSKTRDPKFKMRKRNTKYKTGIYEKRMGPIEIEKKSFENKHFEIRPQH